MTKNHRKGKDEKLEILIKEKRDTLDDINHSAVSKRLAESSYFYEKYPHPVYALPKKSPLLGYQEGMNTNVAGPG
jgi:hypothetical protein